jgi:hypothetical protein
MDFDFVKSAAPGRAPDHPPGALVGPESGQMRVRIVVPPAPGLGAVGDSVDFPSRLPVEAGMKPRAALGKGIFVPFKTGGVGF